MLVSVDLWLALAGGCDNSLRILIAEIPMIGILLCACLFICICTVGRSTDFLLLIGAGFLSCRRRQQLSGATLGATLGALCWLPLQLRRQLRFN